jgi:hypothetical protein
MNETGDWSRLTDAYGDTYDPRPALDTIRNGNADQACDELWQRAHHQGDLGTAAYAIVPELVRLMAEATEPDWRVYALIATIEERRKAGGNPSIPDWLAQSYEAAMREVVLPALAHLGAAENDAEVRSLLAVLAHAKGQPTIGTIALWTEDEREDALGELSCPLSTHCGHRPTMEISVRCEPKTTRLQAIAKRQHSWRWPPPLRLHPRLSGRGGKRLGAMRS